MLLCYWDIHWNSSLCSQMLKVADMGKTYQVGILWGILLWKLALTSRPKFQSVECLSHDGGRNIVRIIPFLWVIKEQLKYQNNNQKIPLLSRIWYPHYKQYTRWLRQCVLWGNQRQRWRNQSAPSEWGPSQTAEAKISLYLYGYLLLMANDLEELGELGWFRSWD